MAGEERAWKAAHQDGWWEWFGHWFFTDPLRMEEFARPFCFIGTAQDLCLLQGIEF